MIRMMALFAAVALVVPAFAADADAKKNTAMAEMFKKLDANSDGKITKEEFAKIVEIAPEKMKEKLKAKAGAVDKLFASFDTDGDGVLSAEEIKKASEGKKKAK